MERVSADGPADSGADSAAGTAARITPYPDGPLIVRGDFVVCDDSGQQIESGRSVALCRCGRSARKPLCDGSHKIKTRTNGKADGTDGAASG